MRYLITIKDQSPFFTEWFDAESHFNNEIGMVVYDLINFNYTTDGKEWKEIEIDNL